jgi:putative peptidoglycan lipid II flippase
VQLVFERGEFGAESTKLTSQALMFYSLGMLGFGVQEILNKAFYSTQDAKTPMYIAMAGIVLNIVLCFVMIKGIHTGLEGLALSASVASCVIAVILLITFNRRYHIFSKNFFVLIIKLFICGIITDIATAYVLSIVDFGTSFIGKILNLSVPGIIGLLLYLISAYVIRVDEICGAVSMLKGKLVKKEG